MRPGEGHAVPPAHRVAEQDELVQPDGVHKAGQVGCESVGGIVAAGSVVSVAAAALVQGVHMIVPAEGFGHIIPDVGVAAQAVEQNQRGRALGAPVQIVQVDAVGGYGSALGHYLGGHTSAPYDLACAKRDVTVSQSERRNEEEAATRQLRAALPRRECGIAAWGQTGVATSIASWGGVFRQKPAALPCCPRW